MHREMASEKDYDESLDKVAETQKSLKKNIQEMQQLTLRRNEFQRVREFYLTAPEWSSAEGREFSGMMELIKNACDSFADLVDEARVYVLLVKNFGRDIAAFTTEAQEDLAPDEEDELLHDWKKSIDRMKDGNDKIEKVKDNFKKILDKLRTAQEKAAGGAVRGREKADASAKSADMSSKVAKGFAAGGAMVGFATGGVGAPIVAGIGILCSKFAEGMYAADSEKQKEWKETYDFVSRQLDDAFAIIKCITADCKKTLNDLSTDSNRLLDKFEKPLNQKKLERSGYFKKKCLQLKKDSEDLQQTCIEYIKKDDEIRRLTGGMGRLSLQ
ncbi:uncharacterized protein [Branchiostoma lanceolatum]|uniref:uncharacterized protein isoform X2 n=1 Tax=Branchiostoma lanceolatum TaxID=7740 RepID=UPI003452C44A